MTLDDLQRQNRRFYGFFGDFGLRHKFQERIVPKLIEIDMDKLHIKFSALNFDFDGPSLDFRGSRKRAHEGIKERYCRKSRYFTVVGQFFVKTVADHCWHAIYHNKHQWRAFQSHQHRWLWKSLNFQNKGFYWFLRFSAAAAAHIPRINCDEMAGDRLTVCEQELL